MPPQTLSLCYSRPRHYFLLLIFAPLLGFYVYFLSISHINILTVMFAPLAMFFASVCVACVKALRWRGPVVVLDDFGIADFRLGEEAVPWRDVVQAQVTANDAFTFLTLRFRNAADAKKYMGVGRFYRSWLDDWFMSGQWKTRLTPLRFRRLELLLRANAFIAHARNS